jgi:hypothetical protein
MKLRHVTGFRVSRLNNTKVTIAGKIALLSLKLRPEGIGQAENLVEEIVTKPSPKRIPEEKMQHEATIRVVPSPRKRQTARPKIETAPVKADTPKPLKVIRRRREEAPRIFETPPKTLPKAMLEGIDLNSELDSEN